MEKTTGKLRKYLDILFSHQAMRIVLLIMVTLRSSALLAPFIGPLVKYTLIWSAAVLVKDLCTKRMLFTNRWRGLLYLFMLLYGISTLVYYRENLARNVATFCYMVTNLFVFYAYDPTQSREEVKREVRNLCHSFMAVSLVTGLLTIVVFVLNIQYRFTYLSSGVEAEGQLGFFSGRMWGILSNPNTTGAVAFINVIMIFICVVMVRNNLSKTRRRFYLVNLIVQAIVFFLSNSRTAWYCMFLFILIVPFLILMWEFPERIKNSTLKKLLKRTVSIALVALLAFSGLENYAQTLLPKFVISTTFFSEQFAQLPNSEDKDLEDPDFSTEVDDVQRDDFGTSLGGRYYLWRAGVGIIANHPLLGVTAENIPTYARLYAAWPTSYEEAERQFYEEQAELERQREEQARLDAEAGILPEEPAEETDEEEEPLVYEPYLPGIDSGLHNMLFQVAASSGLPALLIIVAIALGFLWRLGRYFVWACKRKRLNPFVAAMSAMVLVLLAWSMSETGLIYGISYSSIIFWSFVSYILYFIDAETAVDPEFDKGRRPLLARLSDKVFGRKKGR